MRIVYAIISVKRMFLLICINFRNAMSLSAKQTFVFLGSSTNEYPAKQDVESKAQIGARQI